jgi:hypothetical protein
MHSGPAGRPEIDDFWGLGGPRDPKNIPEGGGRSPPIFWSGFWGLGGRPDPPKLTISGPISKTQEIKDIWASEKAWRYVHVLFPEVPKILILRSRRRKSSIFGVTAAFSLPKTPRRRWGAKPPTCAHGFLGGRRPF